jgi:hypothetical protein
MRVNARGILMEIRMWTVRMPQSSRPISAGADLTDPVPIAVFATVILPVIRMLMELMHHCLNQISVEANLADPALIV